MRTEAVALTLTRRDLLRTAGLLAGAAVALPFMQAATAGGRTRPAFVPPTMPLRIGVMIPRSAIYPHLGESLLAGLRLYFSEVARRPIEVRVADIGNGVGAVTQAAQRLLNEEQLTLLVGMVNAEVAATLHDLLAAADGLFVNAQIGANLPRTADQSPYVFTHSLSYWQANWALGRWAARQLGTRAALVASLYESGYDVPYAFRLGFEGAGGTILATQITHRPLDDNDPARLVASLGDLRPDFVYAAYSGQQAIDFVRAYAAGLGGQVPLVGPGFLTDEYILADQGEAALGVRTAAGWSSDVDNQANRQFVAAYREYAGAIPDTFALLGFETAQLLASATSTGGEAGRRAALALAHFATPRGAMAMDQVTQTDSGPLYLREVRALAGTLANVTVATLAPPSHLDPGIADLRASLRTGWSTPYLSV